MNVQTSGSFFAPMISYVLMLAMSVAVLYGQSTSIVQTPASPEPDDVVRFDVSIGTVDDPVDEVTAIIIEIEYAGFEAAANSGVFVSNHYPTWFNDDGNVACSVELDSTNQRVFLELTRTDGISRSGYGPLASVDGIVITIVDLGKRSSPPKINLTLLPMNVPQSRILQTRTGILVGFLAHPARVSIYSLSGQTLQVKAFGAGPFEWELQGLPSGFYMAGTEEVFKKVFIPSQR